jgi:hypothetical protein
MPEPNLTPNGLRLGDLDGKACDNCAHFVEGKGDYGTCAQFSNYPVKPEYVCSSYTSPQA